MLELGPQIASAAELIRQRFHHIPRVGIILGTGLGNFSEGITVETAIPYDQIPHFPKSTALSHKGQLVCGHVGDVPVATMEGRFHLYEGYPLQQITLPVRVMKALKVELLIVSNASGGMNPRFASGDIMVIEDHINLMGDNPLIGIKDDQLRPRFPNLSRPYDPTLIELALQLARKNNFVAHRGVYVGLTGPNYETRAEYRFLRKIGADAVGMSTVPEVIVAAHVGLRVLALSAVTNLCNPDSLVPASAEGVVAAARSAEPKMRSIVLGVLEMMT